MQTVTEIINRGLVEQRKTKPSSMNSSAERGELLRGLMNTLASWNLIPTLTQELLSSWLGAVSDIPDENLKMGAKKARDIGATYFTLPVFIELCKISAEDMGLPSPEIAYHEACTARDIRTHKWSSPAAYHAGADTGWFDLRNNIADNKKRFFQNYEKRMQQVLSGKMAEVPRHELLPETINRKLSKEESRERLAKMKKELGI